MAVPSVGWTFWAACTNRGFFRSRRGRICGFWPALGAFVWRRGVTRPGASGDAALAGSVCCGGRRASIRSCAAMPAPAVGPGGGASGGYGAFRFSCRGPANRPESSLLRLRCAPTLWPPSARGRVPSTIRSVPVHAAWTGRCAAGRRRQKPGRGAAGGPPCPNGRQSPGACRSGGRAVCMISAYSSKTPARKASSQPSCVLSGRPARAM